MRTLLVAAALAQALTTVPSDGGPAASRRSEASRRTIGFAALKKERDRSLRRSGLRPPAADGGGATRCCGVLGSRSATADPDPGRAALPQFHAQYEAHCGGPAASEAGGPLPAVAPHESARGARPGRPRGHGRLPPTLGLRSWTATAVRYTGPNPTSLRGCARYVAPAD